MKRKILFYALALVAVIIELILYSMLCVALKWEDTGGIIPMVIIFSIMVLTWKVIVGFGKKQEKYLPE